MARPPDLELSVEEVSGVPELAGHAPEWRSLADRAAGSSFFSTWEWIDSWCEAFLAGQELVTILVRRGDRLVGALPLVREARGVLWRSNSLHAPANAHSPRACFLFEGDPVPVVAAILRHLELARSPLRLQVPFLPVDCPGTAALQSPPGGRLLSSSRPSRHSTIVRLEGSWESYLASRPKRVRREWRRKRNRLDRAGEIELVTVTAPSDVPEAMADVFEIERRSWKEREGTSLTTEAGCDSFYGQLARRCAERGWLRLHLLRVDGRPVAHVLAAAYGREYLALKTSYDRDSAELSPGVLIMLHVLEGAFGEEREVFDLLGRESRWKGEMSTGGRAHVDLSLFSPVLLDSRAWALFDTRVMPFARRTLPGLVQAGRRLQGSLGGAARERRSGRGQAE